MKGSILDLDPRLAIAFSGEFSAPSDPLLRKHTLARLYWASIECGEQVADNRWHFNPDWAPIMVAAETGRKFDVSFYQGENLGLLVGDSGRELVVGRGDIDHNLYLEYENFRDIANTTSVIARELGKFFGQFDGWRKDADIWVPPTPEVGEPAA